MNEKRFAFKCEIQSFTREGGLSYQIGYAVIIAESKAEAKRIASENVKLFKRCKIEQVTEAAADAAKDIRWM